MDNTSLHTVNVTIASNAAQGGGGGTGGVTGGGPGASFGGGLTLSDLAALVNTIVADNAATVGADVSGNVFLVNSLISTPAGDYTTLPGSSNLLLATPANLGPLTN